MNEVCYCDRTGEIENREPVVIGAMARRRFDARSAAP